MVEDGPQRCKVYFLKKSEKWKEKMRVGCIGMLNGENAGKGSSRSM